MRLIDSKEIKLHLPRLVIRRSRLSYLLMLILLLSGTLIWGALVIGLEGGIIIRIFFMFASLLCLLLSLIVLKATFDLLKSSNWVAVIGEDSLLLHQNKSNKTETEITVEIPLREINSVKKIIEFQRKHTGEENETVKYKNVYLEISLNETETSILKLLQPPIYVVDNKTIRLAWRDSFTRLTKTTEKFTSLLPIYVNRLNEEVIHPETQIKNIDRELADSIKNMYADGDKIGAIKLLRSKYRLGLKEAKEIVEELAGD